MPARSPDVPLWSSVLHTRLERQSDDQVSVAGAQGGQDALVLPTDVVDALPRDMGMFPVALLCAYSYSTWCWWPWYKYDDTCFIG